MGEIGGAIEDRNKPGEGYLVFTVDLEENFFIFIHFKYEASCFADCSLVIGYSNRFSNLFK